MQTITDIATNRNISPTSARVAVRRAYEKLGEAMPKETTNETPLPEYILALIQNKGAKIGRVNGSAVLKTPEEAESPPITSEQYKAAIDKELSNARSVGEYQKAIQSEISPDTESEVIPVVLPEKKERRARSLPEPEKKGINWNAVLSILPLPMLGLAASFGVYFFSTRFVPEWVAIGEAMAFELTYIGLTASRAISGAKYKRARWVSMAAVAVSVIYNTLAAALHLHPEVLDILKPTENGFWPGVGFWVVAMLHGAPLAILGFFISELGFVKQD